MRFTPRSNKASTVLALLAVPVVYAQGNSNNNNGNNANNQNSNNNNNNNNDDLPDLNAITEEAAQSTDSAENTRATSNASTRSGDSNDAEETGSASSATFPDAVTRTSSNNFGGLTGLPTIAGAGVPDLVIPFTEPAPFMQRSSMPEGTVFIAVGAVLALFGACILLWRVLVAWSINRSVKRSAIASIRGGEKSSGSTWAPHAAGKAAYYKEYETGSSMSLDALNSQGKPLRPFRDDHDVKRQSSAPVNGLFFSPTAQTSNRAASATYDNNRSSAFLPAGYYASPSADVAGTRSSTYGASSAYDRQGQSSRDGYTGASSSSLAVGIGGNSHGTEYFGGQRAPSQVFDDMLDVHGNGPRERY